MFLNQFNHHKNGMEKTYSYLTPDDAKRGIRINRCKEIVGRNLHVGHDGSKALLEDVSFKLESGNLIGLYGRSGSGKTTLVDTITGLLQPKSGEILCFDENNKQHEVSKLSNLFSYIPQETFMVDDTVLYNIVLTSDTHDNQLLEQSLKISGLQHLIDIGDITINQLVGENGSLLSEGKAKD